MSAWEAIVVDGRERDLRAFLAGFAGDRGVDPGMLVLGDDVGLEAGSVGEWLLELIGTGHHVVLAPDTLALALALTVVTGAWLRHRVVTAASAGVAVTAGEFIVDPPTLINLGFEWFVQGDDNRNASVEVSYRKQGTANWKQALPMLRLQGERIKQGDQLDVVTPNMFAGSVLDLEPDTAYEARFVLRDPDGVSGQATKTVTVKTRPEPMPATPAACWRT